MNNKIIKISLFIVFSIILFINNLLGTENQKQDVKNTPDTTCEPAELPQQTNKPKVAVPTSHSNILTLPEITAELADDQRHALVDRIKESPEAMADLIFEHYSQKK